MPDIQEWIDRINKNYGGKDGGELAGHGSKFPYLGIRRFSTGILSLDIALGGGWPFGRMVLNVGVESTGKTLDSIKACVSVENYDHHTKLHRSRCEKELFTPGRALFIDAEGDFDPDWAESHGFNLDWHVIVRPEYGEQVIDIVADAISSNRFSLIVVDSIEAICPATEVEGSAEDWNMGLKARMVNKGINRWRSLLNGRIIRNELGPALLCTNQFRIDIKALPHTDNRTIPGGKNQIFASSIIIYKRPPKYEDSERTERAFVELGGSTRKNKTYIPKQEFNYKMHLTGGDGEKTGDINNVEQMEMFGKKHDLIVKKGSKWVFGDHEFGTLKALKATLREEPEMYEMMWRSIVKAATGSEV